MPLDASLSADVGRAFNSEGYIDFYVNGEYKLGIELLRDNIALPEHTQRFTGETKPDGTVIPGTYRNIPFKEYMIINFRIQGKPGEDRYATFPRSHRHADFCISHDFRSAIITGQDEQGRTRRVSVDLGSR